MMIRRIFLAIVMLLGVVVMAAQSHYMDVYDQSQGTLIESKKAKNSDFSFALFSDLHISASNAESAEDLRRAVKEVNLDPSLAFVIVTGDITERGDRASLLLAKEILGELECSYYVIPGNRDTKYSASGAVDFKRIFGDDKFRIQINGVLFLGVNTGQIGKGSEGHISPQDIVWTKRQLKNIGKRKPVFVVTHHPLLAGSVTNWYELTDVIRKYSVQAVLSGHVHMNMMSNYDGILGIVNRSVLRGDGVNGGYLLYSVLSDSLIVQTKEIGQKPSEWLKLPIEKKMYVEGDEKMFPRADYSLNSKYNQVAEKWEIEAGRCIYSAPCVDGEKVIYATDAGEVKCVNYKKGKELWSFKSMSSIHSAIEIDGDKVVFGSTDNTVYCLNKETGAMQWVLPTKSAVLGTAVVDDGIVYIGTNGSMIAINLSNGEELWTYNEIGASVECKPVVVDNKVMFGAWDNSFYCLNKYNGILLWKWENGDNYRESPAAMWAVEADGRTYVVSPSGEIAAIDINTGKEIWKSAEYAVSESMTMSEDGNTLYVKSKKNNIIAFDVQSATERVKWNKDLGFGEDFNPSAMTEKAGKLVFATESGIIYCVDSQNGDLLWQNKIGNEIVNKICVVDANNLVLTTTAGRVVRLEIKD